MKTFFVLMVLLYPGFSNVVEAAQPASNPYFVSCKNEEYDMQIVMSFDPGRRYFTYEMIYEGLPRGFHAFPEAGFGFDHSKVSYEWKAGELFLKAQILGGNVMNPQFLYSALIRFKDMGPGLFKIMDIEVMDHGQPQNLILFYGLFCQIHQGV